MSIWGGTSQRRSPFRLTSQPFASGLATSRAYSMKSLAAGLSVRCFRLTAVTSLGEAGSLTGNTFRVVYLALNRNIESGSMVRKRPAASRYMVTGMEADETQV